MKNFIAITSLEWRSLLRGLVVVLLLVLPFTFLPTLIRHGFSGYALGQRLPQSALFALLFAMGVILTALIQNYRSLSRKKRLYTFPAFTALQFEQRTQGYNSIIRELSVFLIGKKGNYFFKIDVKETQKDPVKIEIAPFVHVADNEEMISFLMEELQLQEGLFLHRTLRLTKEELQDENILQAELLKLSDEMTNAKITALDLEEEEAER